MVRDELLHVVWGYRSLPYTRTVDVHMWQLRRKLESNPREPRFLRTVRGTGYLFLRTLLPPKNLSPSDCFFASNAEVGISAENYPPLVGKDKTILRRQE